MTDSNFIPNTEAVLVLAVVVAVASDLPDTLPGPRTPRMEMELLWTMLWLLGLLLLLLLCAMGMRMGCCDPEAIAHYIRLEYSPGATCNRRMLLAVAAVVLAVNMASWRWRMDMMSRHWESKVLVRERVGTSAASLVVLVVRVLVRETSAAVGVVAVPVGVVQ
jgi:hypothetical protein